ncbi:MAG: peptidoglycan editing factor PgeF [Bdellovibrionales bacterium]
MSLPFLQSEVLSANERIRHGFFTRQGGVSLAPFDALNGAEKVGDDPAAVAENRRRIIAALGAERLALCRQVHSDRVVQVDAAWDFDHPPEADAMVTKLPGVALGILTADCGCVLLADPVTGVIAASHAGWRGALGGVLDRTLELMESCGVRRSDVVAAVGPCIWQESYEVEAAFLAAFEKENAANLSFFKQGARPGHFLFDLPGYIDAKVTRLGVRTFSPSPADTCADQGRFFSYRRGCLLGAPEKGRMISAIVRRK